MDGLRLYFVLQNYLFFRMYGDVCQPVDKPKLELTLSVLDQGEAWLKCGQSEQLR